MLQPEFKRIFVQKKVFDDLESSARARAILARFPRSEVIEVESHSRSLGPKPEPNQTDPRLWTYDIGCNADLSLDALVCDHPGFLIERFAEMPFAKAQLASEAFLLSHSAEAHELNLSWNPKGEEFLWDPARQTVKPSKPDVLVYRPETRRESLNWFLATVRERLPYCPVRYAF